VAAIADGEPRATIDLDVVISIDLADLPTLAANFEANRFYVAGLADVVSGSLRCLNITHLETIENIDLMISGREKYDLIKFDRRRSYTLPGSGEVARSVKEEILNLVLMKIWYRSPVMKRLKLFARRCWCFTISHSILKPHRGEAIFRSWFKIVEFIRKEYFGS
jgi:hypothetical protein